MSKLVPKQQTADGGVKKKLMQADVPRHSLGEVMCIPEALRDSFAKKPAKPLRIAEACGMSPSSSSWRTLTGAAMAYGLTDGAYGSEQISLTELGKRAVAPTQEGDDRRAMAEALLRPRVIREFLTRYDNNKLPDEKIGRNVLEEMGVPQEASDRTFKLIVDSARSLGLLREVKGNSYVDLSSESLVPADVQVTEVPNAEMVAEAELATTLPPVLAVGIPAPGRVIEPAEEKKNLHKVFVTHGKNLAIVEQLKDVLKVAGFEPHVEVENESGAIPLPEKVMSGMKSCGAAVIHVGAEEKLQTLDGQERLILNSNVLIEIGAAMALYGKRFVLLVQKGVKLPTNLSGLYEVRYEGNELGWDSAMKLLKSLKGFEKDA